MSRETPECVRCRVYETEVILLRTEIAGLRNSVLALTAPRTQNSTVLEIVGMHQPQRLAIEEFVVEGPEFYCQVSLTYRDALSARCMVFLTDPAAFLRFFEDLERDRKGWEGIKQVASVEDQFSIFRCTYEGKMFRPEISMDVSCALDDPSCDPYWTVQLHLDVDPESLSDLAARAKAVFSKAGGIQRNSC